MINDVDDCKRSNPYHDFHETYEEQFEREQEEEELLQHGIRILRRFYASIIYLKNKSALLLFGRSFAGYEKPPKIVYFCEHNGKINLLFDDLRPHTIPRTLQTAGRGGEQKRVPIPTELRHKYGTDRYKRVRLTKEKNGVYVLDFVWRTSIDEDYWEYSDEYAQKGARVYGERVWREAERIVNEERQKKQQLAILQKQRERDSLYLQQVNDYEQDEFGFIPKPQQPKEQTTQQETEDEFF